MDYFNDKVVFVTGGSRGLGLILVRSLLQRGARVGFCARNPVEIEKAITSLNAGTRLIGVPCDISDPEQVRAALRASVDQFGRLDILINNAGIMQVAPFQELSRADWEKMINVNLWGVVNPTLEAIPHLGPGSRIVNITSIGAAVAVPHLASYSSAKFGALGFSLAMHTELRQQGIRVVTLLPGLMRTGSYKNVAYKGQSEAEAGWFSMLARLPVISMDAERAARKILRACEKGTPFSTLGAPAKLARVGAALFPGLTLLALSWMNRVLPRARP